MIDELTGGEEIEYFTRSDLDNAINLYHFILLILDNFTEFSHQRFYLIDGMYLPFCSMTGTQLFFC